MSYVFPGVALYGASSVNLLRYGTGGATRGSLAVGYWPTCDCMQYSGYMVGAVQLLRIYLPHSLKAPGFRVRSSLLTLSLIQA